MNTAAYGIPIILAIAAIILAIQDGKQEKEETSKRGPIKNIRRKAGLAFMFATAIFLFMGIRSLEQHVIDIPIWIGGAISFVLTSAIGLWDALYELQELKKSLSKVCEEDYKNLIGEIEKATKENRN